MRPLSTTLFAPLAARDNHRMVDVRRWESRFKLDLPEFHGDMEPDAFLKWLVSIEEVLDFKEVPEDRRVALVSTHLRGRVQHGGSRPRQCVRNKANPR